MLNVYLQNVKYMIISIYKLTAYNKRKSVIMLNKSSHGS
ncbi:MAG: hypothetical protein XD85_0068 [Parcubacteria bacterium 34_609]|nr:MAG: hypothetical protein XD85_0068 [Parcubacteria bacterium 34_609]KUK99438.1 MAG: hypothetical protein XE08_0031 [Parcubacteria bacterium 32_520]